MEMIMFGLGLMLAIGNESGDPHHIHGCHTRGLGVSLEN